MLVTIHTAPVVLPICSEPVADGAVAVAGDRVVAVGERHAVESSYSGARIRSWPGLLLPGLVNAHTHLQYTDFADLATSGLAFPEWIGQMLQRRARTTPEQWAEATRRGIHRMLASGTTACGDVVSDAGPLVPTARSGIAGVSYIEAVGADTAGWRDRLRALVLGRLDTVPPGRAVGLAPHALYTLSRAAFRDCVDVARGRGLRVHTHLAETTEEVEYVAKGRGRFADLAEQAGWHMELLGQGSGRSPVAEAAALGALGPDVHIAHGVHCDARDRALLREHGTVVTLCVRSNRVLAAGEPPVAAYLAEGSPVALGTDSLASSPSLDLLEEAAVARHLAARQGYAGDDLDQRIVEAATLGGARALGLEDAGLLGPGARADLAVFDVPATDLRASAPYAAVLDAGPGRCVATVLGGRIVHRRTA